MIKFIQEASILQEADIQGTKDGKVVYNAVLQSTDEVNSNGRMYPRSVLETALNECINEMHSRSKLGELDHPIPSGNNVFDEIRQTTVLLSNASHLILDYDFRGNLVYGQMETLGTPMGRTLASLLRDKAQIGTSLRGFAELENDSKGYRVVKAPLVIITYDMVQKPSHSVALVKEVKFESLKHIQESSCGKLVCTSDGKCYLADYFDKLIDQGLIRLENTWV